MPYSSIILSYGTTHSARLKVAPDILQKDNCEIPLMSFYPDERHRGSQLPARIRDQPSSIHEAQVSGKRSVIQFIISCRKQITINSKGAFSDGLQPSHKLQAAALRDTYLSESLGG